MVSKQPAGSQLHVSGLEALMREHASDPAPPVERWNPPYCGDIGLKIRADGTWTYQGSPIGRKSLVRLFSRVLRRDPDGRYYLVTPVEKVDIGVADAPFTVVEMSVEGSGKKQKILFRTNVDDVVVCGKDHRLRFASEPKTKGTQALCARARAARSACRSVDLRSRRVIHKQRCRRRAEARRLE